MGTALLIVQTCLILLLPAGVTWLEPRSRIVRVLSPVIVCYLAGMLLGNLPGRPFDTAWSLTLCSAMIGIGIPLLLFTVDIPAWLRLAPSTVLSFAIVTVTVLGACAGTHILMRGSVEESASLAGMLSGVYIGITANMAAIGAARGVSSETFVMLNAADMVASFGYLFFIMMLAPKLLSRVLPPFRDNGRGTGPGRADDYAMRGPPPIGDGSLAAGLALLCLGLAFAVSRLAPEADRDVAAILAVTTLATAASFVPRIRRLRGSYQMGQYLFLGFCVSMGLTTDFWKLFSGSPLVIVFASFIVTASVGAHLLLAWLFRIDRDTAIVTSVAGIFGPHMIGPVVLVLKNPKVLFSGIASALVGIAVANYLGLGLAWLLERSWP